MKGETEMSIEATELELYMTNDHAIYRAYIEPISKNLQRKWLRGDYNLDLGIKAMRRAVDAAAKQYNMEFGSMTTAWHQMFSTSDRDRVAESLCLSLVAEWRLGNFL